MGVKAIGDFFYFFLVAYTWLSWQGVKKDHPVNFIDCELSGNALDSYFSHYEHALKVLPRS